MSALHRDHSLWRRVAAGWTGAPTLCALLLCARRQGCQSRALRRGLQSGQHRSPWPGMPAGWLARSPCASGAALQGHGESGQRSSERLTSQACPQADQHAVLGGRDRGHRRRGAGRRHLRLCARLQRACDRPVRWGPAPVHAPWCQTARCLASGGGGPVAAAAQPGLRASLGRLQGLHGFCRVWGCRGVPAPCPASDLIKAGPQRQDGRTGHTQPQHSASASTFAQTELSLEVT